MSSGRLVTQFAPAARFAITRTPLEEFAAFVLANTAAIMHGSAILDPYAGSCATLLASASLLAGNCTTVGIERDPGISFEDINKDFDEHSLHHPVLFREDCRSFSVRAAARAAVGGLF